MNLLLKKYFKQSLIISFIIGCGLVLYSVYNNNPVRNYTNQIQQVESNLHKIQETTERCAKEWLNFAATSSNVDFNSGYKPEIENNPNEAVFGFYNDSLVYWSNNLPISSTLLRSVDTAENFTTFSMPDNAWREENQAKVNRTYVAQAYKKGKYKAVSVIVVETVYPYNNEFLRNHFNKELNVPAYTFISPAGMYDGYVISGKNGTPLFVATMEIDDYDNDIKIETSLILIRWLGIIFLVMTIVYFMSRVVFKRKPFVLAFSLAIFFAAVIFAVYKFPAFFTFGESLSSFEFFMFSPEYLSSLGITIVYVYFLFIIFCVLFIKRHIIYEQFQKYSNTKQNEVISVLFLLSLFVCQNLWQLLRVIISDSEIPIEIYKIFEINIYSVILYFLLSLLVAAFIFIQFTCLSLFNKYKNKFIFVGMQILAFAVYFNVSITYEVVLLLIYILVSSIIIIFNKSESIVSRTFLLCSIVSTLYIIAALFSESIKENESISDMFGKSLSGERAPEFEARFKDDIYDKLKDDPQLKQYVQEPVPNKDAIVTYLGQNYFNGYFNSYDFTVTICNRTNSLNVDGEIHPSCKDYFDKEKNEHGQQINTSSNSRNENNSPPLWLMNYSDGRINYFTELHYNNDDIVLYINFSSKLDVQQIGYPELLLDEKTVRSDKKFKSRKFSYAKYYQNKLISQHGAYKYNQELSDSYIDKAKTKSFYNANGYKHKYIQNDDNNSVILSSEEISSFNYFSSFSLLFLFLCIIMFFAMRLGGVHILQMNFRSFNFKQKSIMLLFVLVIILLSIVAISILRYNKQLFDDNRDESIANKTEMIYSEFSERYSNSESIENDYEQTPWLEFLSRIYYTDINIYLNNGGLLSSSRNEIFNKNLIGKHMEFSALRSLSKLERPYIIHKEKIGNLEYYSTYFAFYNNNNKFMCYINLPYFVQQQEINDKWFSLLSTIINIFVVVMMFGIAFAIIISRFLSKPLEKVRVQIGRFNLKGKSEHIKYNNKDEIGALVTAYNNMLDELSISAAKLAQTERESAWHEMARQIAHEIKNPLTPMRLSIQHVLRMKRENNPLWQERFEKLASSLMEQIDTLSATASEFSNFAKLVSQEKQEFDVMALLEEEIMLFSGYDNVRIELHASGEKEKFVYAQREQLQRVFTNLVKNAIQAIDENNGCVDLYASDFDEDTYEFKVVDDGPGVSEEQIPHLFQPNFTTKSSGTGLGLAISKQIIEIFGGTIDYIPTDDGKTCFVIHLPKNKK